MSAGELTRGAVVLGKLPIAGRVKTRLAASLPVAQPSEFAAKLYAAFLNDVFGVVDRALRPEDTRVFSVALEAGDSIAAAAALVPFGWRVVRQPQGDLGVRIEAARAAAEADHVVVLGSDAPGMAPERLSRALLRLATESRDAVFGPTADGGYDLIALPGPRPALLTGIPWSTGREMAETRRAAASARLSVAELDIGSDIDDLDSLLQMLRGTADAPDTAAATKRVAAGALPEFLAEAALD